MIILGLIVLIAAVVVGVAGVAMNSGSEHRLGADFDVFGIQVTGSTGTLFLVGIIVGAVGMLGLSVLLAAARRNARKSRHARRELERTQAALSVDHGATQTPTATQPAGSVPPVSHAAAPQQRSWKHPFGGSASSNPHPSH